MSASRGIFAFNLALGLSATGLGLRTAANKSPTAAAETPIPVMVAAPAVSTSVVSGSSSGPVAGGAKSARNVDAEEVALRLTDALADATVEMPQLKRGLQDMMAHWRRMQAPWIGNAPSGKRSTDDRARLIQEVALRTSKGEVAHLFTTKDGGTVAVDARKWNMSEGSFSQRECIATTTPATIRYRLRVPVGGSLQVAPAVLGVGQALPTGFAGDVTFRVRVTPVGGEGVEVGRLVVPGADRGRWIEQRYDLSTFADKEVDLELITEAVARRDSVRPTLASDPSEPAVAVDPKTPIAAVALWGMPIVFKRATPKLPYSVLWIVVDALRPDVIASFHDEADDEKKLRAKHPPGYALLPKIAGITPHLDALAKRSAIYRKAISAAPWTRPGTIAMLSGMHTAELGLSPFPWMLPDTMLDSYYASKPPLLPLAFRRAGATVRAVVNNNFMLGYAQVGADMGFEVVDDFRYRTMDTPEITQAALATMRAHANERSFLFVNYNSPHEPFDPPEECLARVPKGIFKDDNVRRYMAEACKDDAAIGELLAELDKQGARERTLVVVTADHGETLSERHEMRAVDLDDHTTRFHHAFGMFEETTRIPIILSLPGVIAEGVKVDTRVTNLDLAPTLLKLEGLEADPRHVGVDLLALARGGKIEERPIVTMGRAASALFWGKYRYVERDQLGQSVVYGRGEDAKRSLIRVELFDLDEDPGEIQNLADRAEMKPLMRELSARLKAAKSHVETADAATKPSTAVVADAATIPTVHIRLAGAGKAHRVHANLDAPGATRFVVTPIGLPAESVKFAQLASGEMSKSSVDIFATTAATGLVGFDIIVEPATTPLRWKFFYDDKPLADDAVFGSVLGVTQKGLSAGLDSTAARAFVSAYSFPFVDPELDFGLFVTRDPTSEEGRGPIERVKGGAAAGEIQNALRQWGYAK